MNSLDQLNAILDYVQDPEHDLSTGAPDWQFVFAVILSSQTTDIQVNKITPALFARFSTLQSFADAVQSDVEEMLNTIPFFRNKAKALIGTAKKINDHNGVIPNNLNDLVQLPGVGRKVANVILTNIHSQAAVVVDTHVKRVAHRLGWSKAKTADGVEKDLTKLIPNHQQVQASNALVLFGRYTCKAKRPLCPMCPITNCSSRSI
jgi:endonuclease-3